MKNNLIVLSLLISSFLLFTACEKENNSIGTNPTGNLNGTWIITNIQRTGCMDFSYIYENNCAENPATEACVEGFLIFEDGMQTTIFNIYLFGVLDTDFSSVDDFTYTVEGNKIIACDIGGSQSCQTTTFEITASGEVLTIVGKDETESDCTQTVVARRQ